MMSAYVLPTRLARKLTNLKVVLVRQRVADSLHKRCCRQNLVAHLVHGVLHASAIVLRKGIQGNRLRRVERSVEFRDHALDLIETGESLPFPLGFDLGAENAVPGLAQARVFVAVEAVEGGAGALEHEELVDAALDRDALSLADNGLDGADILAVAHERVGVRLAVNGHARPLVGDDLDVGGMDVRVLRDEVGADNGGEKLGRSDGVLLRQHVDGVLLGVGGYDDGVVRLRVPVGDVALAGKLHCYLGC